jgi:hypothetical protein
MSPTGKTLDGKKRSVPLATAVDMAARMWPTPKASPSGPDYARASREGSGGDDLATAVARAEMFPTPMARDWKDCGEGTSYERTRPGGDSLPQRTGGPLNPTWVEWLMGFPLGWTDSADSATPSSPNAPSGSAAASSKPSGA